MVIPGDTSYAVRNLHWVEKNALVGNSNNPLKCGEEGRRLVSTGLNGVVVEWDIANRCIRNRLTVNVPIWHSEVRGKNLYMACEDGSIRIAKIKKDSIVLIRSMSRAEVKCLSFCITSDEKYIIGGYEDSSIRKWNINNGNCELHFVKETKKSI